MYAHIEMNNTRKSINFKKQYPLLPSSINLSLIIIIFVKMNIAYKSILVWQMYFKKMKLEKISTFFSFVCFKSTICNLSNLL